MFVVTTVSIESETFRKLKYLAADRGVTLRTLLREAVDLLLKVSKKKT